MPDIYPAPAQPTGQRRIVGDWTLRQQAATSRKPELVVRRGSVLIGHAPVGYRFEAEGVSLHPALAPPKVSVGGITATHLGFVQDGSSLRGRLPMRPPDTRLVIDYGFARAELDLAVRTAWWHWIKPVLLQIWSWADRFVRWGLSFLP